MSSPDFRSASDAVLPPDAADVGLRSLLSDDADWWRQAVVYQIYPRSFADANGDGVGDLLGITSRVDYLAELGVDAVWLSPFYPSALADGGYDVDDHRAVDPKIGSLADFDAMVTALHAAGIRVIVDIVPNHSSDRHQWFREALASPAGSPARERYIFRDGLGPDRSQPPSDWVAAFGGPAWEPVGDGQFYLHLFAPEQPDWNWDHPDVWAEYRRTLRFWADRGVDGFRVDVANALAKDLSADPLPSQAEVDAMSGPSSPLWDRDEVHAIYRDWRRVLDTYDPPRSAIGEVWLTDLARKARYADRRGLGQVFNFDLLRADFEAETFRQIIASNLAQAASANTSSTWVFSNHDVIRHATRLALPPAGGFDQAIARDGVWLAGGGTEPPVDPAVGLRRATAATLFMLGLPGSAYLYQGEELGLPEVVDLPPEARQDPTFFRTGGVEVGRDGCRVPLPWTPDGPSFGFGPGSAHLPQPAWFAQFAVTAQQADSASTWNLYRTALAWRRRLQGAETLQWLQAPPGALRFERPGGWQVVMNFTTDPLDLDPTWGAVIVGSAPITDGRLPGESTLWLHRP